MFKRVEKRRLKKKEEEELGLDEDMKEILGMHDTDSEESASESEDSDDPSEDEQGGGPEEETQDLDDDEEMGAVDDGTADADEDDPDITVKQALEDPIYLVSVLPEMKACIICPGKVLKGVKMIELHRTSNAHKRRLKQFETLSLDADPSESAWEILRRGAEEKPKLSLTPSASATSKRAEKKKANSERQKLRREKRKEKRIKQTLQKKSLAAAAGSNAEAKGPAGSSSENAASKKADKKKKQKKDSATPTSPPSKKRKLETASEPNNETSSAPKFANSEVLGKREKRRKHENSEAGATQAMHEVPAAKEQVSIKNIVRSTFDRAKSARERASRGGKGAMKSRSKAVEVP